MLCCVNRKRMKCLNDTIGIWLLNVSIWHGIKSFLYNWANDTSHKCTAQWIAFRLSLHDHFRTYPGRKSRRNWLKNLTKFHVWPSIKIDKSFAPNHSNFCSCYKTWIIFIKCQRKFGKNQQKLKEKITKFARKSDQNPEFSRS